MQSGPPSPPLAAVLHTAGAGRSTMMSGPVSPHWPPSKPPPGLWAPGGRRMVPAVMSSPHAAGSPILMAAVRFRRLSRGLTRPCWATAGGVGGEHGAGALTRTLHSGGGKSGYRPLSSTQSDVGDGGRGSHSSQAGPSQPGR